MRALTITCTIIVLALAVNFCLWLRWREGTTVAEMQRPGTREVIRVRDLPSSAPFWAASFGRLATYHLYRCEYYNYGMSQFRSSQTYQDRGYVVTGISVAWQPDGGAVVTLGNTSKFTCRDGWWAKGVTP